MGEWATGYTAMPAESFGLRHQPFNSPVSNTTVLKTRPHQDAMAFLRRMLADERGVGHIHGPAACGKTSLAVSLLQETRQQMAVAMIDGKGLYASQLLSSILEQFGYEVALNSTDELLNMLTVFLVQQTRSRRPPLVIIDNMHRMARLMDTCIFVKNGPNYSGLGFGGESPDRRGCHGVVGIVEQIDARLSDGPVDAIQVAQQLDQRRLGGAAINAIRGVVAVGISIRDTAATLARLDLVRILDALIAPVGRLVAVVGERDQDAARQAAITLSWLRKG